MIKVILPLLISTLHLCAFNAEVKKDSVSLLINDQAQNHEAGKTFALKAGDLVCFISGEGRVVIKGEKYSKQLSKRSKSCKRLPTGSKETKDYLALVGSRMVEKFGQSQETAVAGVSRKSAKNDTVKNKIIINNTVKYLIIENDQWGPLPVVLQVVDAEDKVIASETNEEELLTSFVFPVSMIKEGYTVKVSNAFDELLLDSMLHFQTVQEK